MVPDLTEENVEEYVRLDFILLFCTFFPAGKSFQARCKVERVGAEMNEANILISNVELIRISFEGKLRFDVIHRLREGSQRLIY